MSTTANALYLPVGGHLVALDLFEDTSILPSFLINERTDATSIDSDYSVEFDAPASQHNLRLLEQALDAQATTTLAYRSVPALLLSDGVETIPRAILYLKGYAEGRIKLQLVAGNKRFTSQLKNADGSDKKLADLDFSRFNHAWTPANILERLPWDFFQQYGYGYEVYDRGKPIDLQNVDPYTLYPSVAGNLILAQIVQEAGFTASGLDKEDFFAALTVPTPNPYTYPQKYRDARLLKAGYFFDGAGPPKYYHQSAFPEELLVFSYVSRKPYHAPEATTGATYFAGRYTVDTLGFYDISATIPTFLGINENSVGSIRAKFQLKVNGTAQFDGFGSDGHDELETDKPVTHTFNPKLTHMLLKPGDEITLWWNGDEIRLPTGITWNVGPYGASTPLPGGLTLATEISLNVTLLPDFPPGGLVKLSEWLPDMSQLDYLKTYLTLGSLSFQVDRYTDHLTISPGYKLLASIPKALNWSGKLDAAARPGRQPERELAFRYGPYGQQNLLQWAEDDTVTAGYGNATLQIADEALPVTYELFTLPFAASEASPANQALLRIANFSEDITTNPITYSPVTAKPRLVLKDSGRAISGQLILVPQHGKPGDSDYRPAQLTAFASTASYFASVPLSLALDGTCLTYYYQDFRAMLDRTRYSKERVRLTVQDVLELDFMRAVWLDSHQDYFALMRVTEFSSRRATECEFLRLNGVYLPPPVIPGEGQEFYSGEFYNVEFY